LPLFTDRNILQGSVAMHLRCGGIFKNDYCKFTSESVQEF